MTAMLCENSRILTFIRDVVSSETPLRKFRHSLRINGLNKLFLMQLTAL